MTCPRKAVAGLAHVLQVSEDETCWWTPPPPPPASSWLSTLQQVASVYCSPSLPIEDAFLAHHTQDHCNENSCAYAKRIQLPLILLRSITWSRGQRRLRLLPCQWLEALETWTECVCMLGGRDLLSKYFNAPSNPWYTSMSASCLSSHYLPWNLCHTWSSTHHRTMWFLLAKCSSAEPPTLYGQTVCKCSKHTPLIVNHSEYMC